ncbi:transposase [Corynebacterium belfantii]|uniref:transposase n=1 Tax=Corynebacterium belfantii TaxID=2014537 RepID=UPI0018D339B3|nr:transposase [Corynebacterium belfantii]MBG9259317.1 transposase [Corynebacterium belfantii]MBG9266095.1 transposase [Corynebacterium belfantii]
MTSTTTTRHYNRPGTTTNKQAAKKAMSTLIDTLAGMKDARVAEIAQLGRTMNKRRKNIPANIRHTINALQNRKSH